MDARDAQAQEDWWPPPLGSELPDYDPEVQGPRRPNQPYPPVHDVPWDWDYYTVANGWDYFSFANAVRAGVSEHPWLAGLVALGAALLVVPVRFFVSAMGVVALLVERVFGAGAAALSTLVGLGGLVVVTFALLKG